MSTSGETVPARLPDALREELDADERLLWSGTPNARRYAWRAMPLPLILSSVLGILFSFSLYTAINILIQAHSSDGTETSMFEAWISVVISALILVACVMMPIITWRIMHSRARATTYALTSTRVLELRLGSRGLRRVKSVEPSHPLELTRRDARGDIGDLLLYPASNGPTPARLVLVGIEHPREVDRLIRHAFSQQP